MVLLSLAASLVLDTSFPWGFGRARAFSGVRSGFVSFVHQLRSVLSPLFSPSNEDQFAFLSNINMYFRYYYVNHQ